MTYDEYLQTDHWKRLAEETKRLAGYRCQVCNAEGELHAHHRTYERKGDELQSDLVCLCASCHRKFHNKDTEPVKKDMCMITDEEYYQMVGAQTRERYLANLFLMYENEPERLRDCIAEIYRGQILLHRLGLMTPYGKPVP
jgi:hypothetical protein